MATSIPGDAPVPREAMLDTVAAQAKAIDEVIGLARQRLSIFDIDLAQADWHGAQRASVLGDFLKRNRKARVDMILHDTRWLEANCPRIVALLRLNSHAMTVYRTGAEARNAMDPLIIADNRHFVHRFHIEQPRAALGIEQPQLARPLVMRFEEIWKTGEPGLGASVLGL